MCHVVRNLLNPCSELFPKENYNFLTKFPYNIQNVNTTFLDFLWIVSASFECRCNVRSMIKGQFYRSNKFESQNYPATFNITVIKKHSRNISVLLHRQFKDTNYEPDDGYFLRIFFEIDNSLSPGKYTDMPSNSNVASVHFSENDFCFFDVTCATIVVKCVIWMAEIKFTENEASAIQDKKFILSLREDKLLTPKTYNDMAYLMDRELESGIFSGRQDEDFANQKILLLKRTFLFSDVLARRLECLRKNIPFGNFTPVALILGHIYNGIIHHIEDWECLELYKMSSVYGLPYLRQECIIFLAKNLADYDFLVDVLVETSKLEDWELLDAALSHFLKYEDSVVACDRWRELMTYNPHQVRILETLLKRKFQVLSHII